jgi:hypothetical protein
MFDTPTDTSPWPPDENSNGVSLAPELVPYTATESQYDSYTDKDSGTDADAGSDSQGIVMSPVSDTYVSPDQGGDSSTLQISATVPLGSSGGSSQVTDNESTSDTYNNQIQGSDGIAGDGTPTNTSVETQQSSGSYSRDYDRVDTYSPGNSVSCNDQVSQSYSNNDTTTTTTAEGVTTVNDQQTNSIQGSETTEDINNGAGTYNGNPVFYLEDDQVSNAYQDTDNIANGDDQWERDSQSSTDTHTAGNLVYTWDMVSDFTNGSSTNGDTNTGDQSSQGTSTGYVVLDGEVIKDWTESNGTGGAMGPMQARTRRGTGRQVTRAVGPTLDPRSLIRITYIRPARFKRT